MDRDIHLDVLFVLDHIFRDLEPELLAELVIILGHVCVDLRKLQVTLLERKVHTVLPETHLGVDVHAGLRPPALFAQPQCVVQVVVRLPSERIRGGSGEEPE